MKDDKMFFAHLQDEMLRLFLENAIQKKSLGSFFKKGSSEKFDLAIEDISISENSVATFTAKSGTEYVKVKEPCNFTATLSIFSEHLEHSRKIYYFDLFTRFLFQNRYFTPFYPDRYNDIPGLQERFASFCGEITPSQNKIENKSGFFEFRFFYKGPYHDGELIKRIKRVEQRNVSLNRANV